MHILGLMTAPESEIVRIHSSSGTTGLPVIIPYTAKDVDDWAIMFKRCYELAGVSTNMDRIQSHPGYGLWTAGIGFQGQRQKSWGLWSYLWNGNTDKQLQMMQDMKSLSFVRRLPMHFFLQRRSRNVVSKIRFY